jgi:hypothetical protein
MAGDFGTQRPPIGNYYRGLDRLVQEERLQKLRLTGVYGAWNAACAITLTHTPDAYVLTVTGKRTDGIGEDGFQRDGLPYLLGVLADTFAKANHDASPLYVRHVEPAHWHKHVTKKWAVRHHSPTRFQAKTSIQTPADATWCGDSLAFGPSARRFIAYLPTLLESVTLLGLYEEPTTPEHLRRVVITLEGVDVTDKLIRRLNPQERKVYERRWAGDKTIATREAVAKRLRIGAPRIYQIESKIHRKFQYHTYRLSTDPSWQV